MNPVEPTGSSAGCARFNRGREVWSEVKPFVLLGRAGVVPSTARADRKSRSTADLVLVPNQEVRS